MVENIKNEIFYAKNGCDKKIVNFIIEMQVDLNRLLKERFRDYYS